MANDELLGYDPASLQRWTGTEMGTLDTRSLSKLKVAMCDNISLQTFPVGVLKSPVTTYFICLAL